MCRALNRPVLLIPEQLCKVDSHPGQLRKLSLGNVSKARAWVRTPVLGLQNLSLVPDTMLTDRRMESVPARQRMPQLKFEELSEDQ